jgi:hypothetical protein
VAVGNKHRGEHEKEFQKSLAAVCARAAATIFFLEITLLFLTPLLDQKELRDHNNEHKAFSPRMSSLILYF